MAARGRARRSRRWIQAAIRRPGALRAQLGVPPGRPIPADVLARAARAPGVLGRRARLALTLRRLGRRRGRRARAA